MIKALFIDLDGTLLDDGKRVSRRSRDLLAACKAKGLQLYIATGRPPLLCEMGVLDEETLALFDGGVFSNGACMILDGVKQYNAMDVKVVQEVVAAVCKQEKANLVLQLENEIHAFRFPLDASYEGPWGFPFDEVLTLDAADAAAVSKLMVFHEGLIDSVTPLPNALVADLERIAKNRAQLYVDGVRLWAQMMGADVTKVRGIEAVRTRLGLAKDELAVFGDDINDVEMLEAYPISYAMRNAAEAIRAKARFVTAWDNNCDGVARTAAEIALL